MHMSDDWNGSARQMAFIGLAAAAAFGLGVLWVLNEMTEGLWW